MKPRFRISSASHFTLNAKQFGSELRCITRQYEQEWHKSPLSTRRLVLLPLLVSPPSPPRPHHHHHNHHLLQGWPTSTHRRATQFGACLTAARVYTYKVKVQRAGGVELQCCCLRRERYAKSTVESQGSSVKGKGKGKVHPCTDTEALYRPYGP